MTMFNIEPFQKNRKYISSLKKTEKVALNEPSIEVKEE